jgi:hypothetical protein
VPYIEHTDVQLCHLERDLASAQPQHVAKGNHGKGHEGGKQVDARRQQVEAAVHGGGHHILFGEELDGIGEHCVDQPQTGKTEHGGPIGADAVLDERAALALHPAEEAGERQHHEDDHDRLSCRDGEFESHVVSVTLARGDR